MTVKVLRAEPPINPPIIAIAVPCQYAPTREQLEIDSIDKDGIRFHISGNGYMRVSITDVKNLIKYLEEIIEQVSPTTTTTAA